MIKANPHMKVAVAHYVKNSVFAEAVADIEGAGATILMERRAMEFFASLHYLAPTAIVVYLLEPYFKAFLNKLGEDHYELLKSGLKKLWSAALAEDRVLRSTLVGTTGKIASSSFSIDLSFVTKLTNGQTLRLLFQSGISQSDFEKAVAMFSRLISACEHRPGVLSSRRHASRVTQNILIAFIDGRLVKVDQYESARKGEIVFNELRISHGSLFEEG